MTDSAKPYPVQKTDAQWREQLDPTQYQVARQAATERPFTGRYWDHFEAGRYDCIGCGTPLFESGSKFDAGCGWPSYAEPINADVVERIRDASHGMVRIEVAEGRKEWAAAFASSQLGFLVSGGVVGPDEAPVLLATVVVIVASLLQVAWLNREARRSTRCCG